ncbi:aminopeptidase RNPEPL1 [Phyllopteryx taeniolatus]|uniref:aminopeptidase RNPEPL1 n=1 Tax=Phyllopteryx taeniolatus TaxID=161469 RepID=UPI002AD260CE|nr:aminopeptidase RNPEPL1 [Phyllopteryx taeniolatus]XP_061639219.1 aminopeptidase RNPEPL1 [Phyllopteryx taeniolatus]
MSAPARATPLPTPRAPSPASLCCCRKSPSAGGRCAGESPAAADGGSGRRPPADVASASNLVDFRLRHFHLDLRVNFALKEMSGWLVLDLVPLVAGVRTLVLDAHPSLLVHAVDCETSDGREPACLAFRLEPFADFGSSLNVDLPDPVEAGTHVRVTVRYTATDGPAMWWLDSELTCGQDRPLVFTQGHSVSNRSFFPCFDSPAVKSTYTAAVRVPDDVTVLMSASRSWYSKAERVFHFSMDAPVPAYLVALVAGNLQHVDVGPRSRVWAEPCLLSCAAKKLGGSVERWLTVAEGLFGPYLWGRCDLVFLPPAFPIVAMENPCLTFIIASILESSDFLLIDVVHEIAHAWFGNAVTNATWEEMWLSEGLATYAQRRITTEAYGAAFTCLESAVRLDALHRQLRLLGDSNPVSRLQVKLEPGVNPSTLMNLFTYEKGFCFVSYLSSLCGDVRRFDGFLRDYISQFKFQSVVTQDFLDLFLATFPKAAQEEGVDFQRWLTGCGAPPCEPDLSAGGTLTGPVRDLIRVWTRGCAPEPQEEAAATADVAGWSTFQVVLFLDCMLDHTPLTHEVMSRLRACYASLLDGLNAEVQVRWLQMVVRSLFYPDLPRLNDFLRKHTSRMYTVPLYEDLATGAMHGVAVEAFQQTRQRLHPNLRRTLQQILSQGQQDAHARLTPLRPPDADAVSLRDVNVSA